MTQSNLTYGRVVTATLEINNGGDTSRGYDIEARIDVSDGKVTTVHSGTVSDMECGERLAEFNTYNGIDTLNVTYSTPEGRATILAAVEDLIGVARKAEVDITAINQ